MEKKVTIEYKTKKDYCHCCDQKLPEPKISDYKYFNLTKENFLDWSEDWDEIALYDYQVDIREFVYNTIRFFAAGSHDSIIIDKSEFDKVNQFFINKVLNS